MTRSRAGAGMPARLCAALAFAAFVTACAPPPKLMTLPSGVATPAPDAPDAFAAATRTCRGVSTLTATIGASGTIGGRRIPHANLIVGVNRAGALRLEATVPLGGSAVVFVVKPVSAQVGPSAVVYQSTLLLPRDNRFLETTQPRDVLEALTGVPLDPMGLRDTLTGCAEAMGTAEHRGDDWIAAQYGDGEAFFRRGKPAGWQLVAATHLPRAADAWRAEYRDFSAGLPRTIRLAAQNGRFNLTLTLSDVDINTGIDEAAFAVKVPPGAVPMTLVELRDAGALQ